MKNMIKDKYNLLVENTFFSNVLGDVGLDETSKKRLMMKNDLFRTLFMKKQGVIVKICGT